MMRDFAADRHGCGTRISDGNVSMNSELELELALRRADRFLLIQRLEQIVILL
jgi:hypothetical protein